MTDFKAKMNQIRFRLGTPDPAGGAYSTPTDPLAEFGGRSRQGEGLGWRRGRKGRGKGEGGGSGGEGPHVTLEPGPLRATPLMISCFLWCEPTFGKKIRKIPSEAGATVPRNLPSMICYVPTWSSHVDKPIFRITNITVARESRPHTYNV